MQRLYIYIRIYIYIYRYDILFCIDIRFSAIMEVENKESDHIVQNSPSRARNIPLPGFVTEIRVFRHVTR